MSHLTHVTPTGRKRHRPYRTWGGTILVLQIEEKGIVTNFFAGQVDSEWVTRWRDAGAEDLTIEESKEC